MNHSLIKKITEKKSFKVIVKPNSKKNEILGFNHLRDALIISIKAEAKNNKANNELIKFLSKLLKKRVDIIKGLKSKEKILKII